MQYKSLSWVKSKGSEGATEGTWCEGKAAQGKVAGAAK